MTKNRGSRIISLIMALIVFTSSTGFSIDFHYCQGKLKSSRINGTAKTCHELSSTTSSCHHKIAKSTKDSCSEEDSKNCCSHETEYFKSDTDQINSQLVLDQIDVLGSFLIAFINTYIWNINLVEKEANSFQVYKPPLISTDIQLLNQSFLL